MSRTSNWAMKQVEQAKEDMKSWPKWMVETTRVSGRRHTEVAHTRANDTTAADNKKSVNRKGR